MNRSLSCLLFVRNGEATLETLVDDALESSADLTSRVEVILTDEGSTDDTVEAAHELANRYRQVRVLAQAGSDDAAGLLAAAVRSSFGDTLLFRSSDSRFGFYSLGRLWRAIDEFDLAIASEPCSIGSGPLASLRRIFWPAASAGERSALAWLMRREAAERLMPIPMAASELIARTQECGLRQAVVSFDDQAGDISEPANWRPRPHYARVKTRRQANRDVC